MVRAFRKLRCNGEIECDHGEDEYRCPSSGDRIGYRLDKHRGQKNRQRTINWSYFPYIKVEMITLPNQMEYYAMSKKKLKTGSNEAMAGAFMCNRGLAVQSNQNIRCFCSGTYYGDRCQYFNDRITIITHLNLTHTAYMQSESGTVVIKIVAFFLFENEEVLDWHEFHVVPAIERLGYTKHKFQLTYSRFDRLLKYKKQRHFNRTDIIHNHPFSVEFLVFELKENSSVELGVWKYLIYYDFLPSFRLATVLRFPQTYLNENNNPCKNITCHSNAICMPLFTKQRESYTCSCKSGFYGRHCQLFWENCNNYCSTLSKCRPISRSLVSNAKQPLCICPLDHFGPRCNLKYNACQSVVCRNNGTCRHTFDYSGQRSFVCICQNYFYGDLCQNEKSSIYITIANFSLMNDALASVVQYYDVNNVTFELALRYQQVSRGIPIHVQYRHSQIEAPVLGILKAYVSLTAFNYYILYIQPNISMINVTSAPEYCPHSSSLIQTSQIISGKNVPPAFKYHQICHNDSSRLCFYDASYLCICQTNQSQVDCFSHDLLLDQCESCFSGGKCLQGDSKELNNFVCLCPYCYRGRLCEFSMQTFTLTLDSLITSDQYVVQSLYITITFILFTVGFVNNLCSFATFRRPTPRKLSVGNWLLLVTILNQCALLCLLGKLIHILLGSVTPWTNDTSCKMINYLLVLFTRSTYWLTSWITVARLIMIISPASRLIHKPKVAIWSSILTFLSLMSMHTHEILFSKSIHESDSTNAFCVLDFGQRVVLKEYHRVSALLHYVVPFLIQVVSITLLIIIVARHRVKLVKDKVTFNKLFKKEFIIRKELYVAPSIIILSALPQVILSFILSCTQLNDWQRHSILTTFILSYTPQVFSFLIHVFPSDVYKKEFDDSSLAKTFCIRLVMRRKISNY